MQNANELNWSEMKRNEESRMERTPNNGVCVLHVAVYFRLIHLVLQDDRERMILAKVKAKSSSERQYCDTGISFTRFVRLAARAPAHQNKKSDQINHVHMNPNYVNILVMHHIRAELEMLVEMAAFRCGGKRIQKSEAQKGGKWKEKIQHPSTRTKEHSIHMTQRRRIKKMAHKR